MRKIILFLSIFLMAVSTAFAQNNTVVFDNQSGESALVKLIGPTTKDVEVPNGDKQSVDASAGQYIIKVRYGTPGKYHYSKGQEFEVTETATASSETTITLHKVVSGNYEAKPITEKDFTGASSSHEPAKETEGTKDSRILEQAKAFFQRYVELENAFDARLADMYSDSLKLTVQSTGLVSTNGVAYKGLLPVMLSTARLGNETSEYTDIRYEMENPDTVRISAHVAARQKKFSNILLLVRREGKELKIVEEVRKD